MLHPDGRGLCDTLRKVGLLAEPHPQAQAQLWGWWVAAAQPVARQPLCRRGLRSALLIGLGLILGHQWQASIHTSKRLPLTGGRAREEELVFLQSDFWL